MKNFLRKKIKKIKKKINNMTLKLEKWQKHDIKTKNNQKMKKFKLFDKPLRNYVILEGSVHFLFFMVGQEFSVQD